MTGCVVILGGFNCWIWTCLLFGQLIWKEMDISFHTDTYDIYIYIYIYI